MTVLGFFLTVLFSATTGFILGRLRGENVCNESWRSLIEGKNKEIQELSRRYYDLIYSVGHKFVGETRHDTAKRYILQAETQTQLSEVEKGHEASNNNL